MILATRTLMIFLSNCDVLATRVPVEFASLRARRAWLKYSDLIDRCMCRVESIGGIARWMILSLCPCNVVFYRSVVSYGLMQVMVMVG